MTNVGSETLEFDEVRPAGSRWALGLVLGAAISAILVWTHNVPTGLTVQDRAALQAHTIKWGLPSRVDHTNYAEELRYIVQAQNSIFSAVPGNDGIPHGESREPADVLGRGSGLCYDRSRTIEKLLGYAGFETRHVSVYKTSATGSLVKSLLRRNVSSHAVTEVLTAKGWIVVGSNYPWVSHGRNGSPVSLQEMRADKTFKYTNLDKSPGAGIFDQDFDYVYGLYSRHGKFYAPYNFIPDVNFADLLQNFNPT
ncbi:MAG: transglutaminase domain-containing protein [Pseudomonadota bacterium]